MVGMGPTSQTPHLSLDLGTVSTDTSVWNPSGLDIFVDLGLPTVATGLEKATPMCLPNAQGHLVVDIGDHGCQEAADVQSEPIISLDSRSCQLQPGYIEELVPCEERRFTYGRGEDHQKNATNGEAKANISAENCGTNSKNLKTFSTANLFSQIAEHDTTIDAYSTSSSFSKNSADGSVSDNGNPNSLSASTVFGIEGLEEEDIWAACQLMELSHEGMGEVVDETFAAFRLLELGVYCSSSVSFSTNGEKTDYCLEDLHGRSVKSQSAPLDSFCTDIPRYDICASRSDEENDPWGAGRHELCVSTSSDLGSFKSKRIKPYNDSYYGECERDDDDWDILDRPPHKRQYKSLRQMYCLPPSSS